jgi:hypothetical protein
MGGAARSKMLSRLGQAQIAIDRKVYLAGVVVLLTIVFPPADRAQT